MKIGVLGAGQLGRMLALSGIPMGLDFIFYTDQPSDCVKSLGKTIHAPYDDFNSLENFLHNVDIVTYENENIPIATIKYINQSNVVNPPVSGLKTMQDRLLEKRFFKKLAIPTTTFYVIDKKADLLTLCQNNHLPVVLKKRKNSYDGKGQIVIKDADQLAYIDDEQCKDCIAEEFVNFNREVSLIGCRDIQGNFLFYDICQNVHRNGTLFCTANKSNDRLFDNAKYHLSRIMNEFNYVGVCTLEFFDVNNTLLANELAPRVHNSGHWTIEGSITSQFENHLRSILGWPLGSTESYGNFLLYNILGKLPNEKELLKYKGIKFHDYQKKPATGRKLGHITLAQPNTANITCEIEKILFGEAVL